MKKSFILFLLFLFASKIFAQTPTLTVNLTSSNWSSINYSSITAALSKLLSLGTTGTIWVASGTYTEPELIIPTGVTVIGGFPTSATSPTQRVYPGVATSAQLTILSGSYAHRVATVQGGTLDGFVITKGYVYDATTDNSLPMNGNGGGVMINGGIVQNCILHDNVAAKKAPTPGNIPGTFVASIGDIYCTDINTLLNPTLLHPTYSLNSSGKIIASLTGGIPSGKTAHGIVFYVDTSPTTGHFLIMGKVSTGAIQPWTNPPFDIPGIPNITDVSTATADFNGRSETDSIIAYIPRYITANSNQYYTQPVNYDGIKYAYEYNTPSGTQGQWYLPAAGELYKIWSVYPQMDACASYILNWISIGNSMFPNQVYWSSTEYNNDNVWVLNAYNYPWGSWGLNYVGKTQGGYTIPISSKTLTTQ
jgi:hypothetical protein